MSDMTPPPRVWPTLRATVAAAGGEVTAAPHDTDYGSPDFSLRDPAGNRCSFGTYRGEPRKSGTK